MNAIRALTILCLCFVLNGCVELDRKLLVNTDGSGTLTERIQLRGTIAAMMQGLASDKDTVVERTQVDEYAKRLGEGVRVSSLRPLPENEGLGAIAVFSFDDLNKLQLDPDPRTAKDTEHKDSRPPAKPITFQFTPGPLAELIINMGDHEFNFSAPKSMQQAKPSEDAPKFARKMLQEILGGMRVAMQVEVVGQVIESNASYREGNRIILMELEFDRIIADADGSKALQSPPGEKSKSMREAIKNIPGLKLEPKPQIRILFSAQSMALAKPMMSVFTDIQ